MNAHRTEDTNRAADVDPSSTELKIGAGQGSDGSIGGGDHATGNGELVDDDDVFTWSDDAGYYGEDERRLDAGAGEQIPPSIGEEAIPTIGDGDEERRLNGRLGVSKHWEYWGDEETYRVGPSWTGGGKSSKTKAGKTKSNKRRCRIPRTGWPV